MAEAVQPLNPETAPAAVRAAQGAVWLGFGAMVLLYALSYFQRTAVPGTVFDEIQSDCGLGAAAVTALGALFVYVYGGMQIAVGFAVDRYGGRRMILVGGGAMAAGALLFPWCHGWVPLVLARVLTGFGASFMYLCILRETHDLFAARHFTVLMGAALFCGMVGGMGGTLPLQCVVAAAGWRPALFGAGILTACAVGLAWLCLRRVHERRPAAPPFSFRPLLVVLRNRRSLALLISGLLNFPVYFVIQAVLGKKFLQDFVGLSPAAAASFTLIMAGVSAASLFLGGLSVRWLDQRRKPCLVACGFFVLIATLILLGGTLWAAPGWLFLIAYVFLAMANAASPAAAAVMKELNPQHAVALSVATYNALCYLGAGLVGNLAGAILDRFHDRATVTPLGLVYPREAYVVLFACLVGIAVACVVMYFLTPETHGRSVGEARTPRRNDEARLRGGHGALTRS